LVQSKDIKPNASLAVSTTILPRECRVFKTDSTHDCKHTPQH
jgi:hypothetical protein